MKNLLCRPVVAVLALLLTVATAPLPAFADAPGGTPEPDPPARAQETLPADAVPVPSDYYEYDEDAPWLYYDMTEEEYYEEFEPWRATGQTEDEYWDDYWKNHETNQRTEALLEFGFTDTDGPNVVVGGEPLNFTGAKPLVKSGAVMVPARAVLEALGAELVYDGKTKTLTAAAKGATVAFTAGSDTARAERDGRTEEIELAAAFFIDGATASAYAPLRALAEGLGLEVYWDSRYKVAEIVDKDGLISEINAKFTVLNALLQSELDAAKASFASDKATRTDVEFEASAEARYDAGYGGYADLPSNVQEGDAKLSGAFTVLSGKEGFDVSGDAKLEINGFEDILGEIEEDRELSELFAELKKGVPFDLLLDYADAAAYLRLPPLSYAYPLLDKNTWIAWRASDYESDFDFQEVKEAMEAFLAEEDLTVGGLLYMSFFEGSSADLSPYYGAYGFDRSSGLLTVVRVLEPFLGDAYMEKDGDARVISLNRLELFNVFKKLVEEEDDLHIFGDAYTDLLDTVPAAGYTLRIGGADGAFDSMELDVNVKVKYSSYSYSDEDDGYVEFRYNASAGPRETSVDYGVTAENSGPLDSGALRVHAEAVSAPTDEKPRTAPPAGSKTVSADEL